MQDFEKAISEKMIAENMINKNVIDEGMIDERLLYDISEKVAENSKSITNRINPLENMFSYLVWGTIFILTELALLSVGKTLHLLIMAGAYCLVAGCGLCKWKSKMLFLAHIVWIVVFAYFLTYDISYCFNVKGKLNLIIAYYPAVSQRFRQLEMMILQILVNVTFISFIILMFKLITEEVPEETSRQEHVKELLLKGMLRFMAESLIIGSIFMLKIGSINFFSRVITLILLIPLPVSGSKCIHEARNNMLYIGYGVADRQEGVLRRNRIMFFVDTVLLAGMALLFIGIRYIPYYLDKNSFHIHYIDADDRWLVYNQENGIMEENGVDISKEKPEGIEADLKVEQIKEQLIALGVRRDILDSMLPADILRFDGTKKVLKSVREDTVFYSTSEYEEGTGSHKEKINFTVTVYACELFNGYKSERVKKDTNNSYLYEILVYVEFTDASSELYKDKYIKLDCCMGRETGFWGNFANKKGYVDNSWVYLADMGDTTRYYVGIKPFLNEWEFDYSLTAMPKGENYRAYDIGRMYAIDEEDDKNLIQIRIDVFREEAYFDDETNTLTNQYLEYEGDKSCMFQIRMMRNNNEGYGIEEYDNPEDFYDDGYDSSNPVNICLIDFWAQSGK